MKQNYYSIYGKTVFLCYIFIVIKKIKILISATKRSSFKLKYWLYAAKRSKRQAALKNETLWSIFFLLSYFGCYFIAFEKWFPENKKQVGWEKTIF